MAAATIPSTKGLNKPGIIPSLFFVSFVFLVGIGSTQAVPAGKPNSCGSLRSMARIYMASGGYEKAQPFLVKALNQAKETNASDSERSACMLDLAYLYMKQGRLAEAETTCLSGLELQEKIYSQNHPYVAYTLRILSEIYLRQSRYHKAFETLERALTIVRGCSLEDDKELAPFKVDMARLLAIQGNYVKAESYFTEAIATIEKNYGPNHLYTAKVLCSFASLYVLEERYTEAEELISKAQPVQENIYGENHHFLIPLWLVKSSIYEGEGNFVNAKLLLEKSLESIEKNTGYGQPIECDVLSRLGKLYILNNEYTKAGNVLQRASEILKDSQFSNSGLTAVVLNNLAKVYINRGKYSKAQNLCEMALEILENVFDGYHPYVADVLETQVQLNLKTGDMTGVAKLEQRIEQIREHKRVAYVPIAQVIN